MRYAGLGISIAAGAVAATLFASGPAIAPRSFGIAVNAAGAPQGQQTPPVFRGGTSFVRVDAYPRRDGRVIEGLTADDFEVTEDGKPQTVESFQFIKFETVFVDAERRDPTSIADSDRQAADPSNRLFVVYLDPYNTHVDGALNVQSTVMAFLTRTIGARDLFGVMTPEVAPSQLVFGRRLETLDSDLAEFWRSAQLDNGRTDWPRTPVERRLTECAGQESSGLLARYREDALLTNLEGLMHRLRGLREERKNILFISEGWRPARYGSLTTARPGGGSIPQIGVSPRGRLGTGNQQPIGSDDNWCDQQVGRLASLDFEDRFRQLLRLARQSNVSFYPVDVGGLRVSANNGARNTLLELAENTDGIAVTNTNDLTGAVRRLTDSMAAYYLLGYYSTNAAADGRYREIRVRVKQPGATVSARPGYFAPTPAALAAAKAPPPPPPSPVDDELGRLARARPDAELHTYGIHAGDHLDVVVELASRLVSGPWKSGADIRATLRGTTGAPVVISGRVEPGMRSARLALPLDQSQPGPWTIDVRLSADAGVLDAATSIAAPAGPLFNDAMLFRASPSARSIPKVTADPQFRRVERLHAEWRPLKALTARSARLLDRQGQALPMEPVLSERDEGGVRVLVLDLNLAPLGEGSYVLELTGTSGSETERDLVAFKIVR